MPVCMAMNPSAPSDAAVNRDGARIAQDTSAVLVTIAPSRIATAIAVATGSALSELVTVAHGHLKRDVLRNFAHVYSE